MVYASTFRCSRAAVVTLWLTTAALSWAQAQTAATPSAADFVPIDVMEFLVEGNTVLSAVAIEVAVTPFLGPKRSVADLDAARAALERVYQTAGYLTVFVDLPEQKVDDGVVRLKVLEGRIARTSVTGSRYYSQGYIREKVPTFTEGTVPNFTAAQTELALVNRTEQRRVQPVLKAGKEPGTVEVELKVADQLPISGTVELNNQHAPDTDPWRVQATLRYDNLFQRDHGLSLTATVAPRKPSQATSLVLNYSVPQDNGHTLIGYLVSSNSDVQTLGGTSVLGNGTTLGLRYAIPFTGRSTSNGFHSLTVGVDYKDLSEKVLFGGDTISTPLRYLPFQAAYSGNWSDKDAQTSVTATVIAASRSIFKRSITCPGSAEPVDQFACKRFGADGSFASLRLGGRHSQAVGPVQVAVRFASQVATAQLASSEQFSIGGAETVRGYLEGEASGDQGVAGSLEVRSPNLARSVNSLWSTGTDAVLSEVTLFAFGDVGRTQITQPLAEQASRVWLIGTGAGLTVAGRPGWNLGLEWAQARKPGSSTASGDSRFHIRLGLKY
jgi:hemolysin activation/secretion protein